MKYTIGDWQCKCGTLKGLEYLRMTCSNCSAKIMTEHPHEEKVVCPECGSLNKNRVIKCDVCGGPVELQLKYSISECSERGMTFAVPLKVTFRLFVYDKDPETGTRMMRDAKEEEVYFGEIPLMTEYGTFIINGTERVIVSQLHRSPGVFFTKEGGRTYLAKIIPYRGSWVEFEYDQKEVLSVRIDRKRKFHGSVFLRALGLETNEDILRQFYTATTLEPAKDGSYDLKIPPSVLDQERLKDRQARGVRRQYVLFAGITLTSEEIETLDSGEAITRNVSRSDVERANFVADVVDLETGEILFEANDLVPDDVAEQVGSRQTTPLEIFFPDWELCGNLLTNTLSKDHTASSKDALMEIYRRMRPGDPPTIESARSLFYGMFFDAKRYDFSRVGRFKFNIKLDTDVPVDPEDPVGRRLLQGDQLPPTAAQGHRPGRRHRQPWQPPGACRGRAAREPVPHRLGANGAGDQREDVGPSGHRLGDAPRPDQLKACHRGDQGVFRLVPALAVHGPDEPAFRGDPQASPLGPGSGWSVA